MIQAPCCAPSSENQPVLEKLSSNSPGPPPRWLLLGLGRPGLQKHPCGLDLEHEDAAEVSAAWLHAAAQESGSAARPAKQPPAHCGCLVQEEATNDGAAPPEMLCSCSSWAWEGAERSFPPGSLLEGQGLPFGVHPPNPPCSSRSLRCQVEGPWAGGEAAEPAHMLPNGEQ